MAGTPLSDALIAKIRETFVAKQGSINGTAFELDVNPATVRRHVRELIPLFPVHTGGRKPIDPREANESLKSKLRELLNEPDDDEPEPDEEPGEAEILSHKEKGDDADVIYVSDVLITTEAEALAHGKIDTTVWYVASMEITAWQTAMKLKANGQPEKPVVKQQWRIALKLKRIQPKPFQDALKSAFAEMKAYAPTYQSIERKRPDDPHLLEIDIFDAHFGKLAWKPETGQNYDLKIAESVYRNAGEDLLAKTTGYNIERILVPIGNDFFHIDNALNQTTGGTPQDTDGRYGKIIKAGNMAMVYLLEMLREVAPVKVVRVPGNHDFYASYHLALFLDAWFHNAANVTIDTEPCSRKYEHYGQSLIGFTHGNEEKPVDLPTIMATEKPLEWGATTYHEWRCGHFHQSKKVRTTDIDTKQGVEIRWLRSLSATDAWHYRRGYVGTRRAAECYLTSYEHGYTGHFVANVRE